MYGTLPFPADRHRTGQASQKNAELGILSTCCWNLSLNPISTPALGKSLTREWTTSQVHLNGAKSAVLLISPESLDETTSSSCTDRNFKMSYRNF